MADERDASSALQPARADRRWLLPSVKWRGAVRCASMPASEPRPASSAEAQPASPAALPAIPPEAEKWKP
jgi:hypothetical protein